MSSTWGLLDPNETVVTWAQKKCYRFEINFKIIFKVWAIKICKNKSIYNFRYGLKIGLKIFFLIP